MNEQELEALGYTAKFDYSQYSHDNNINVIPEEAFRRLTADTFDTITDILKETYGPYGNSIMISSGNETTVTKDGYNIYNALGFSQQYKKMVYLAIQKIIERVNNNVGDGTTSCILLADKIFHHLNESIKTTEDKRNVKDALDYIEKDLQSSSELMFDRNPNGGCIQPLTEESLNSLLMLASNYDTNLVDTLLDAFCPECKDPSDPRTPIVSMNNVIVDASHPYEAMQTDYKVTFLPGDYRVKVNMDNRFSLMLSKPTKMRVILYDHVFGESEWNYLMAGVGDTNMTPTMLIARRFDDVFMNNIFFRHLKRLELVKQQTPYYIVELMGGYFQDEINDLAEVLQTKVHTIHNLEIKEDEITEATLSVSNFDCLAFYDLTPPQEHIDILTLQYSKEKSYAKRTLLNDRIKALEMKTKDALIVIKAESSLELKLLSDKIDDCIAIAHSAMDYGIVPNLLHYGYQRIFRYLNNDPTESVKRKVESAILWSIEELAEDVWRSKYNNATDEEYQKWRDVIGTFYLNSDKKSYDIIEDAIVDVSTLPTSSQYDIEILIASISIVKYLLSSRALIFDANLMRPQSDGHFQFNA
jgi:hypothetical protein